MWKTGLCAALFAVLATACGDDVAGEAAPADGTAGGPAVDGDGDGQAQDRSQDAASNGDTGDGDASGETTSDPLEVGGPEPGFLEEVEDGWQVLLTADWEMPAGEEGYWCARYTLPEDVYFGATVPVSPLGTHHTLLSLVEEPSQPDGIAECDAGTNGSVMISGSGVGTEALEFPEGVAMRAPKGSQLLLNLHLYNPTEEMLTGRSGTLVKTMAAADMEEEAVMTMAGPVQLEIPQGRHTQNGKCTFDKDVTLVNVGPHMHQLGVHMRIVANSSVDGEVVLFDDAYSFQEQRIYPIDPVEMKAGDTLEVECTYDNDTDSLVRFGDSSFSEMCFAGVTHYPARARSGPNSFICFN